MPSLEIHSVAVGVVPLLEYAQEIPSLAVESGTLFSASVADQSSILFSASIFSRPKHLLSDKQRLQVQKGVKIARKLRLQFPKEIQNQLAHIRFSKLLGPDDAELHSILAMSNSDAGQKKPCELGHAVRKTPLHPHHSITEKKAFLTDLLFFSDNIRIRPILHNTTATVDS